MKVLSENTLFRALTSVFERSPLQINQLLESDSELIKLRNGQVLAITTDCIVEELESGLYEDPYMIGWMTVTVNLSDIAAVGAKPLGILLQENIPIDYPEDKLKLLQKGISDACNAHNTFVLGGDTNRGEQFQMGGTAIGLIENGNVISRKGCQEGDILMVSDRMGLGNGFGFGQFFKHETNFNITYLPTAHPIQGELIREFGTCCIDTSDGFFPALCNLMEINSNGFKLTSEIDKFLIPEVLQISHFFNLPSWIFLAGPHGEYELMFTIPSEKLNPFINNASEMNWHPIQIGEVTSDRSFQSIVNDNLNHIDPFLIANLFTECKGNPEHYLQELLKINEQWKMHI